MLKRIEKAWDVMNILVPDSKFFKRKSQSKSAFQKKLFADVSDPVGYSVPSGDCNYLCPVMLYRTRRAKRREMPDMIKAEMNSIIPQFKPIDVAPFKISRLS